ncbi:MAG TPA: hypothetical protein VD978_14510 [Azospirillum sp.]|nr:hypothetical protein [Azospirillum sp.]
MEHPDPAGHLAAYKSALTALTGRADHPTAFASPVQVDIVILSLAVLVLAFVLFFSRTKGK